ncbi:MAG: hypothetical protein GTO45_19655 [Candidatus Aminicenantes bacterium]|nr:hypothetical protein [Candidatus Aminicenantes bacterium]NIM81008.1 hypothetical protein [Candidatus Aminicenantes bacterium]NIN20387.1 hypothetical protein [Candidatus Aminicenantes bacterium]NIN44160.1 hypothetical protein [Candidatus Aminicenantes bacterium]NIN86978.1 hypothetical protein [Candidatus Aminicenantes bacterium]
MKKKENSENKRHVEVILVVPLGVDPRIFLWGIHSIKDYLSKTCKFASIRLWDFRNDTFYEELNKHYSMSLSKLFLSMKEHQMNTFFGVTTSPYIFMGLAAGAGDDFFKIARLYKWLRPSCSRDLRVLKKKVDEHIIQKIGNYIKENQDAKRVWAFSVYDYTLFFSLHIARLIKQNDPKASVIFGGDYFNFQNAKEIIKGKRIKTDNGIPDVDGIVVGYGEEVMREIVSQQRNGTSLSTFQLEGFINDAYLQNPHSRTEVNTPKFYEKLPTEPIVSYARKDRSGEIRVLSQRGCSWGKCIFCTQIDKERFYPISVDHLIQNIQNEIKNHTGKDSPLRITFDSDENSIDMFIDFIKYFNTIEDPGMRFDITLWIQVKSFRKKVAEALAQIDSKKIRVLLKLNFESLNDETLRNMRKGHSPLQAIEAAKSGQDSGHSFITNYFTHFPLETDESVEREVKILKRVAHLFMPPKGEGVFFPYFSNNRDGIYQEQDKYMVKIRRRRGDSWLKSIFGIDLPFSQWSHYYDERPKTGYHGRYGLLTWTLYKIIKTSDARYRPLQRAKMNWPIPKLRLKRRAASFGIFLQLNALIIFSYFLLLPFGKRKFFRQRTHLFKYLTKVTDTPITGTDSEGALQASCRPKARMISKMAHVRPSHFFLQDNSLKKEYNGPEKKENWTRELHSNELRVLRYLYWTRKRSKVVETFKNEISEQEITEIINRHINLGTVVQFKDLLLSVVNDPGYWK